MPERLRPHSKRPRSAHLLLALAKRKDARERDGRDAAGLPEWINKHLSDGVPAQVPLTVCF
jgi:hypothetical protein